MSEEAMLDELDDDLTALERGQTLGIRAAEVGFDWPNVLDALAKVSEEIAELREELDGGNIDRESVSDEIGDVLFAVTNVARKLEVDAEEAMERTNRKFACRFSYILEELQSAGRNVEDVSLEEMEAIWQRAKSADEEGAVTSR